MKQEKKTAKFVDSKINTRIRDFLDGKRMSAKDFAEAVGVTSESVRQWRSGYARPDIDKILVIAETMECSVEYLLGSSETEKIENISANEDFNLWEEASIELRKLKEKDFGEGKLLGGIKPKKSDICCTNIISYYISNPQFWEILEKQMYNVAQYYTNQDYRNQFDQLIQKGGINPFDFANNIINRNFDDMFKEFVKTYLKNTYPNMNIDDI